MGKHRLTWTGDGALDLSQILDDRGVPVQFTQKGQSVAVPSAVVAHPVIKRYLKSGLVAEALDVQITTSAPAPRVQTAPPKKVVVEKVDVTAVYEEPKKIVSEDTTVKAEPPLNLFDMDAPPESIDDAGDPKSGGKKPRRGSK